MALGGRYNKDSRLLHFINEMLRPWLHDFLTVMLLAGTQPDLESKVCDPRSVSESSSSGKLWLGLPDVLDDIAEVPGSFLVQWLSNFAS